ncbi:hypothetical protein B0H11DRAFT_2189526 [Mycena galericulata]|nr:hypothetical protein B0H11DRAFT_2189526 [Mycena galericulata]
MKYRISRLDSNELVPVTLPPAPDAPRPVGIHFGVNVVSRCEIELLFLQIDDGESVPIENTPGKRAPLFVVSRISSLRNALALNRGPTYRDYVFAGGSVNTMRSQINIAREIIFGARDYGSIVWAKDLCIVANSSRARFGVAVTEGVRMGNSSLLAWGKGMLP